MIAKKLWVAALLSAAAFAGGIGLTISSGWLITMAATQPPILTLTVAIVGVRFFGISRSAFRYAERVTSHSVVFQELTSVRTKIYAAIVQSPISEIRSFVQGSFSKKIVDDVERAQEYHLRDILPRLSSWISVSIGTLLGALIEPRSLIVTIPIGLMFLFLIPTITQRYVFPSADSVEEAENELADSLSISPAELLEAEVFGYRSTLITQQIDAMSKVVKREARMLRRISVMQVFAILAFGASLIGIVLIASTLHRPPHVRITMVIFLPLVIYEAITAWYPNLFTNAKLLRAQESVKQLASREAVPALPSHKPEGRELKADNVKVSWGKGFMKPLTFEASPQNPLRILGENGSGKSTLALGMSGLLPYQGSITCDGYELAELGNPESFIAAALQNGHIFNTSVRENLKIAHPAASDKELIHALSLLELDYLGLDEMVGEFGRTLSGGERKRIGVARALLSPAPFIILDEPLEHLDFDRARRIEEKIVSTINGRTLIVITHSGWSQISNTLTLHR